MNGADGHGGPPGAVSADERFDQLQRQLREVSENVDGLQDVPRIDRLRRLPRFISNDPEFWFVQIESAFSNCRITTEATKAHHIIAELDPEFLICARDIILTRPEPANIFTLIKNRLVATYSISTEARLRQLLKGDISTDGKPSLILTRLRSLGDTHCSEEVIRSVFLDQLPSSTRAILAASNVVGLQDLAVLADKVFEASNLSSSCSAVSSGVTPSSASNSCTLLTIETQINDLVARVNALSTRSSRGGNDRSRSASRGDHRVSWNPSSSRGDKLITVGTIINKK
ncbi:uncharacterized protein LOC122509771 [Leptopilina heterotoma]|uniref:uncharacterized protein LOC122509771 n=1 Tax=Leptopilina heterotoma TaxID=63436 RepID=UPI001CA89493|nr:uncharacterized protein LOC122509771 [Leptopilina heterotoma]